LLVTVFARASYSRDIFVTVTNPDRAATCLKNPCTGITNWPGSNMYRETQLTQLTSNIAAKTRSKPAASIYLDSYVTQILHTMTGGGLRKLPLLPCRYGACNTYD